VRQRVPYPARTAAPRAALAEVAGGGKRQDAEPVDDLGDGEVRRQPSRQLPEIVQCRERVLGLRPASAQALVNENGGPRRKRIPPAPTSRVVVSCS
jgi:hypothetical protein